MAAGAGPNVITKAGDAVPSRFTHSLRHCSLNTEQSTGARRFWSLPSLSGWVHSRRRIAVAGIAFLIAMLGVASCILGGLYLLFRDDHPSDEVKKRRKRLLVSNWK
jgi:hypothetical protein